MEIVIRDRSGLNGGGSATVHIDSCARLVRLDLARALYAGTDTTLMERRYCANPYVFGAPLHTVQSAVNSFRRCWSVSVAVDYCPCADRERFYVLGRQAHRRGEKAAPALNAEVMDALVGVPGGRGLVIMSAFVQGWDDADFDADDD